MTDRVRLLLLEDDPLDAELMEREIRAAGVAFESRRVESRADYVAALEDYRPDVVLSDNGLPSFDALGALALAREHCPRSSFIVVSGTLGEELAIGMLKSGATDYVLKQRLERLGPVVQRALEEQRDRRSARRAEAATRKANERFRRAFEDAPIGMALIDLGDQIIHVNRSFCELLGRKATEVLGSSIVDFTHPDDREICARALRQARSADRRSSRGEQRLVHAGGSTIWVTVSVSLLQDEPGNQPYCIAQFEDVTAFKQAQAQLIEQALHDQLTGLPNRALIRDRVDEALARSRRNGSLVAVLFVDLDRFKLVNDSLGHDAGDQLLVAVANRLRGALRDGDTAARIGGDEFIIVCDSLSDPLDAFTIAARAAEAIAEPLTVADHELTVTASVGIALAKGADRDAEALIRDADVAMYSAKQHGGGGCELFDEGMRISAVRRLETEGALRRALDHGEIAVHYQPIVDLATGSVKGFESLARWIHPEHGVLDASRFVPVAESSALIGLLGHLVLRESCLSAAEWLKTHPELTVSINVSARQLSSPDLVETIAGVLGETGVDPAALCLEITESALIIAPESTAQSLFALKDLGVRVSIDDFGTGYASLTYLDTFEPDIIKVDRSFVGRLGSDRQSSAIVTAVVALAHSLGMTAIAEGVETVEQLAVLQSIGCEQAQGYLFSPARPGRESSRLLEDAIQYTGLVRQSRT